MFGWPIGKCKRLARYARPARAELFTTVFNVLLMLFRVDYVLLILALLI